MRIFILGGAKMDIRMLSQKLINWGVKHQAKDLYILPKERGFTIFFKTNNKKKIFKELSQKVGEKLIFHFKFIGSMDVSEKRKAQVGSVTYLISTKKYRLRLSTVGDFKQRESLVIRFLHAFGQSQEDYFFPEQLETIKQQVKKKGLYLFCGPVGSGKTTLMYKLAKREGIDYQVITIEDPVEIEEESFLQLQTNEKIGLTYDSLIKVCLRHHPDILIIGEIRDALTAKAALRASLTGLTVFATIHAKSVTGVYQRLFDLGIPEIELFNSLKGVIYQRLLACHTVKKEKSAALFDFDFTGNKETQWLKILRKAWAYGFIDDLTFEKEASY